MNSGNNQWYVFDGNALNGPYTEQQLLDDQPPGEIPSDFLVSGVGQHSWVFLDQWKQARRGGASTSYESSAASFEGFIDDQVRGLKSFIEKPSKGKTENQLLRKASDYEYRIVDSTKSTSYTTAYCEPSNPTEVAKKHLLLQGRLNLGVPRPFLVEAFIRWPLTLGISGVLWFRSSWQELGWYLTGKPPQKDVGFWSLFAPWVYFLWVFRLSQNVQIAEKRNGYRAVNPYFTLILMLVPPLVICYLQRAMNNLWVSAIKNYEARK